VYRQKFDKREEGTLLSLKRLYRFHSFVSLHTESPDNYRGRFRTPALSLSLSLSFSLSLSKTLRGSLEGEESELLSACRLIRGQESEPLSAPLPASHPPSVARPIYLLNSCASASRVKSAAQTCHSSSRVARRNLHTRN